MDSFIEPSSVVTAEQVKNMDPSTALRDPLTVRDPWIAKEILEWCL